MAVRWTLSFKSFLGHDCVVYIYDNDYSGEANSLTPASTPFVTRADNSDDPFETIRKQSAQISFVVNSDNIIENIIPAYATQRPVVLTQDGVVSWVGFISEELLTQPYGDWPNVVSVNAKSLLAVAAGIPFTTSVGRCSLLTVLDDIMGIAPVSMSAIIPTYIYNKITTVQNWNFQSVDSGVKKSQFLSEVLDEWCTFYGISICEHRNHLCVIQIDQNANDFTEYSGEESQEWQETDCTRMSDITICGKDCEIGYTKAYGKVYGKFQTNNSKADGIWEMPSLIDNFQILGWSTDVGRSMCTFVSGGDFTSYCNGEPRDVVYDWTQEYFYGLGQLIRMQDRNPTLTWKYGSGYSDAIIVGSTKRGTKSIAMTINCGGFYLEDEWAALNITGSISATNIDIIGQDFYKKLYIKIKIDNYYLQVTQQGGYLPEFSWTTDESDCYIPVKSGRFTMEDHIITLTWQNLRYLDSVNGFAIDLPPIGNGYHTLDVTLLSNAESDSEYGGYASLNYLIQDLSFDIIRAVNNPIGFGTSLEFNEFEVSNNTIFQDSYDVFCFITGRRGNQYGSGTVNCYEDEIGINRRADYLRVPHKTLTLITRHIFSPVQSLLPDGYQVMAQSIDWRDDKNKMVIIK